MRAPSMEVQRWSTRWKTKRRPWDAAVTVLVAFAALLGAAEVRGGKEGPEAAGVPGQGGGHGPERCCGPGCAGRTGSERNTWMR